MKCVARNIILDVRQQIFVGGDLKSRRPVFPLNLKSATGVDVCESVDRSFLSFDVPIAAHTGQMAARNQADTPTEDNDRDPFHAESHSMITMRRQLALDSTNSTKDMSPKRPGDALLCSLKLRRPRSTPLLAITAQFSS
jgi:hypothetical protein